MLSFLIIKFIEVDPSSFSKKIPSVTPSIIVVSVIIKPIAKSDCPMTKVDRSTYAGFSNKLSKGTPNVLGREIYR